MMESKNAKLQLNLKSVQQPSLSSTSSSKSGEQDVDVAMYDNDCMRAWGGIAVSTTTWKHVNSNDKIRTVQILLVTGARVISRFEFSQVNHKRKD